MSVNAQYNLAEPTSLPTRIAAYQRRRMFQAFLRMTHIAADDTILDVGVTSDRSYVHSNYLEAWYPHKSRITAVGLNDASFLEQQYPGVRFVYGDGRMLPFADVCVDFAHSSAVIEHIGSAAMQRRFLSELWRVARRGIFVTTPNRWFPIEVHTLLPGLHWLPPVLFRGLLVIMGYDFFAAEDHLNLMSRRSLTEAAKRAGLTCIRVSSVSLLGWPSNLMLCALKA